MTDEPKWLERADVLQIHDEQIELYGGLPGLKHSGTLDSTLARPKNLNAYQAPDVFELAAFGLARNHCFFDGNKRTAAASAGVFLLDNEFLLLPTDGGVLMFEGLAAGRVTLRWFRTVTVAYVI